MRVCNLRFGLAAIVAVMLSTAAAGDELKAGSQSWTGFYFGIDGGYGLGDRGADWSGNAATEATYLSSGGLARSTPVKPAGFLAGIHAGYDRQFGRYVFGIETDLASANIRGNGGLSTGSTVTTVDNSNLPLFTVNNYSQYQSSTEQKLHSLGTLRGRLGILATDRLLLYATGGLAYGRATLSAAVANSGVDSEFFTASDHVLFFNQRYPACQDICASGSTSRWLVGGTVGAGLEYALLDRWTARVEYIYYNLGSVSVTVADPQFPAQSFSARASFAGQLARVGLSYQFD
jgi:outer membrane immunogenic protein